MAITGGGVACFQHGDASFLLQDFYVAELASNFIIYLLVEDVEAWHASIVASGLAQSCGVEFGPM
jgi:hypothetical protein